MLPSLRPDWNYALAASALVLAVAIVGLWVPTAAGWPQSDSWSHIAALREWSTDLWSPGHSHMPVDDPSARFIPPYLPIAVLGAVTGWSGVTLFGVSAMAGSALVFFALYVFYRRLVPDKPWAPLIGLTAMVFLWGLGLPWSNKLSLRSLLEVAGYPSTWATGFGLLLVVAVDRYAERGRPMDLAWIVALSAIHITGI